jgi:hypothetical protein
MSETRKPNDLFDAPNIPLPFIAGKIPLSLQALDYERSLEHRSEISFRYQLRFFHPKEHHA